MRMHRGAIWIPQLLFVSFRLVEFQLDLERARYRRCCDWTVRLVFSRSQYGPVDIDIQVEWVSRLVLVRRTSFSTPAPPGVCIKDDRGFQFDFGSRLSGSNHTRDSWWMRASAGNTPDECEDALVRSYSQACALCLSSRRAADHASPHTGEGD